MATRMFKRIRRKPLQDSNNSGLEEPPPPYYYSENSTVSADIVKPVTGYIENQAVEEVQLGQNVGNEHEVLVVRRGYESSELRRGSLETANVERRGSLENEYLQRAGEVLMGPAQAHREGGSGLLDLPVPPPPPSIPRRPVPPLPPPPRRTAPQSPPPPAVVRACYGPVPPPLPPKQRSTSPVRAVNTIQSQGMTNESPAPYPPATSTSPDAGSIHEPELRHFLYGSEEDNDGSDDAYGSDASDDSFMAAYKKSQARLNEANKLSLKKINITKAVEKEDWSNAFHLLNELIGTMDGQGEPIPVEWYLDLVRFGITASIMPAPEILIRLPSNSEEVNGTKAVSKKLQMDAMILEGIIATKKEDERASIRWFLKASKFARRHEFIEEMNICHWMLREKYRKSGETKEEQIYTSLTPAGYGLANIMNILKPRVFVTNVINESLKWERCIRLLDELAAHKDVAKNKEKKEQYLEILGCLSVVVHPISSTTIAEIYDMEAMEVFKMIESALFLFKTPTSVDSIVEFKDPLIPKVITSQGSDQGHSYFSLPAEHVNAALTLKILKKMNRSLKEDICDFKMYGTPGTQVKKERLMKYIPPSLEYACKCWFYHYKAGKLVLTAEMLKIFLEEHWLHWIEAMSLMGLLNLALGVAKELRVLSSEQGEGLLPATVKRIENLVKFLERYSNAIIQTPLQVYHLEKLFEFEESPALSATPKTNIKIDIHDSRNQDAKLKQLEEGYKDLLTVVKPGADEKQAGAFSAGLRLVAYNIVDAQIVIVKDLMSKGEGAILGHQQEKIDEIHFSPKVAEDNIVALVAEPPRVMLWDISKPSHFVTHFPDHEDQKKHLTMKFSPDGKYIAFLSGWTKVTVRKTDTGEKVWNVLNNGTCTILGMAFQQDSSALAIVDGIAHIKIARGSAPSDRFVYLSKWSGVAMPDDADIRILNDQSNRILVRAKYKGVFITSQDGTETKVLDGGDTVGRKMNAVVSPNGKRIAVIRDRGPITIFDTASGKCIQTFYRLNQMYGETTVAAAFLSSGDRLITISKEMGMRVWELMVDVEVKGEWVVRGDEKVMWIPGNYHSRIAEVGKSNRVVLTHPSGRAIEIEIGIDKGRVMSSGGGYGLVSSVMAYLPSLPRGLPSMPRFGM